MEIQHTAKRATHAMDIPNLVELQLNSYRWFLEEGLKELFDSFSPIYDFTGTTSIELLDFTLGEPKYTLEQCRSRDVTFESPIKARVRLTGSGNEVIESEVYLGDLPLMTDKGTFVVNGAERVVVSQLSRSAGIYFRDSLNLSLNWEFFATLIPSEGPWVDIETDASDAITVRIGQNKKFAITTLLRALHHFDVANPNGVFDVAYTELVGKKLAAPVIDPVTGEILLETGATVDADMYRQATKTLGGEKAVRLLQSKVEVVSPPVENDAQILEHFGKHVTLEAPDAEALTGKYALDDITDGAKKLLTPAYGRIEKELAKRIAALELPSITVLEVPRFIAATLDMEDPKVIDQATALIDIYHKIRPGDPATAESARALLQSMFFDTRRYDLAKVGRHKLNKKLSQSLPLSIRAITKNDVLAVIEYIMGLAEANTSPDATPEMQMRYTTDDIDHLENKRVRSVGELLYSQLRMGFLRMEKVAKERMTSLDTENVIPQVVLSVKPISAAIKSFFGSSQLSQFMDQTNPLAELTHKRRLSALGPGGLSRQSAKLEVRDVHHSHYGRICPIETPEGPNIGLIGSMAVHARVDTFGFLESPYRRVLNSQVTNEIDWLPADNEHHFKIAAANAPLTDDERFANPTMQVRHNNQYPVVPTGEIDYMDVSPQQLVSVATAMIPFLENDDANRALMGANMQRQAVPTLRPDAPVVKTGIEARAALDSGAIVVAKRGGRVRKVTSEEIVIEASGGKIDTYPLLNMVRSNQATCITQRPIVDNGQRVKQGQVLADGPCTDGGELALGQNVLVAFMPWNGYNYEDAILLSQRLVRDDVFTSIHIEKYELEARDTKLGPEEITRDIPNVGEDALKDLDDNGVIRVGAEVRADDILVGKVAPKGQGELTAEERLIIAIFGKKAEETRDVSLRVPHGEKGKIVDVKVFSRFKFKDASGNLFHFSKRPDPNEMVSPYDGSDLERLPPDELQAGVNKLVRVYIAQKRKVMEGDKMAGRHGNKGVVSKILPEADMPFLADGTPVDIVLNPLGVPSRMNIGQIMETHLGFVAREFGAQFVEPIFEGSTEEEILQEMARYGEKRRREMLVKYVATDLHIRVDFPEVEDERNQKLSDLFGPLEAALRDLPASELERVAQILAAPPVAATNGAVPGDYPFQALIEAVAERVWRRVGFHEDSCKSELRDGRTGEKFNMPVSVGRIYMLKLAHLVDDKIHARSTGPYSLVTQQPLGGKAQFGGQRFGEMEVWALEAYGAAYTLQEILTIKSDDVLGRVKTYESIVKGDAMLEPGVPESFKILVNELQSLGLKVTVEDAQGSEIDLKDKDEDYMDEEAARRRSALRKMEAAEDPLLT